MTEPQQAQPDLSVWHVPGRTPLVLYSREVCERIVADAFEALRRSSGADEAGGVLFGSADDDEVKIVASRTFRRGSGGPFVFGSDDHVRMQEMIQATASEPDLRKLVPVGCYRARIGGELALSDGDLEIWNRHFPFRWQIVLLLRIEEGAPVRAGFYFRPPKGVARVDAPYKEFELEAPPPPKTEQDNLPSYLPRELFRIPDERGPGRAKWYAFGALAALGAAGAGYQAAKLHVTAPEPVTDAGLRLSERDGLLAASWRRDSPVVRNLRNGHLVISDGGQLSLMPLTDSRLASASFQTVRSSEDIRVKIVGTGPAGEPVVVQTARFVGPLAGLDRGDDKGGGQPSREDLNELRRARKQLDAQLNSNRASEEQIARLTRQARNRPALPPAETVRPAERPPDPKPVAAVPATQPPAPAPAASTPTPAPVAPVQIPQPEPAQYSGPTSGRIIWTGYLPANTSLTISGRSPSAGTLSGALPAVQARVSVYAAEITSAGLSLFTANPARANATEARSARTGWMNTTFVYDAARAQDARLAESPSPASPQRIVIRSGDRPLSAAVIDWQVVR